MASQLHYETVTPLLREILNELMVEPFFQPFRLVGGTSLSLRLGHRKSADIDLFTNATYGSLDFLAFERYFEGHFNYYDKVDASDIVGMGRSYYVGESEKNNVKIDLYYYEEFRDSCDVIDGIRVASLDDVTAMKVDVVLRGGRKKDFWDLHELLDTYSIAEMLELHEKRYEYTHDRNLIINNFSDFTSADEDFDPICLRDKDWEIIKLDFTELSEQLKQE